MTDQRCPELPSVLQIHCHYRSGYGGEDAVVEEEKRLLELHGHTVSQVRWHNRAFTDSHSVAAAAVYSCWNPHAYREIRGAIRAQQPDIIHVHNTFAALSPSVLWAAKKEGRPVVVTLHNYRLICANAILYRRGAPCTRCVHVPLAGILHGCRYNGSVAQGACIAVIQMLHHAIGTYRRGVDVFIVLSRFQRDVMIRAGLPACRLFVKPNSAGRCRDARDMIRRRIITFVGQIREGKGIDLLLNAWASIAHSSYVLHIIGTGPDSCEYAGVGADVVWRGSLPREEVMAAIAESRWLALPSRLYEGCPMTVLEAKAAGVPSIVPAHGSFGELVHDGVDGITFHPGDVGSLRAALSQALELSESCWERLSDAAAADYRARYSESANYEQLMQAYGLAMGRDLAPWGDGGHSATNGALSGTHPDL